MQDSNIPVKFPIVWGNAAGSGAIRAIPVASQIGVQNGAASLTDGFPPNCLIPIASGGSWPYGQDFNGILKQITAWNQWAQAGGPVGYDAAFSASIGGYPRGAVIASATFGQFWLCTADNTTTNPDAGGANWQRVPIGMASGAMSGGGSQTLTAANWGQLIEVGSGVTMTLPGASSVPAMVVSFLFTGAGTVSLNGGQFSGGILSTQTSVNGSAGAFLSVKSDGTNWCLVAASPDILGFATAAALAAEVARAEAAEAPMATEAWVNALNKPLAASTSAAGGTYSNITATVSFTAPGPGYLLLTASRNYSYAPANTGAVSSAINGTVVCNDSTLTSVSHSWVQYTGGGSVSGRINSVSDSCAQTAYVSLLYVPYI